MQLRHGGGGAGPQTLASGPTWRWAQEAGWGEPVPAVGQPSPTHRQSPRDVTQYPPEARPSAVWVQTGAAGSLRSPPAHGRSGTCRAGVGKSASPPAPLLAKVVNFSPK